MACLTATVWRFAVEQDATTATEYAVMLGVLVVVAAGALSSIGSKMDSAVSHLDSSLLAGAAPKNFK